MGRRLVPDDALSMTTSDQHHDATNRERYALRRAMRQSQDAEEQRQRELAGLDDAIGAAKRAIKQDYRAQHYGRDHGRPLAWREPRSGG
jgi:hypothetical protein